MPASSLPERRDANGSWLGQGDTFSASGWEPRRTISRYRAGRSRRALNDGGGRSRGAPARAFAANSWRFFWIGWRVDNRPILATESASQFDGRRWSGRRRAAAFVPRPPEEVGRSCQSTHLAPSGPEPATLLWPWLRRCVFSRRSVRVARTTRR